MAEPKPAAAQPARKKVTIPMLMEKMKKGEPIVQLAVYDYETAIVADRVGIDILLSGKRNNYRVVLRKSSSGTTHFGFASGAPPARPKPYSCAPLETRCLGESCAGGLRSAGWSRGPKR